MWLELLMYKQTHLVIQFPHIIMYCVYTVWIHTAFSTLWMSALKICADAVTDLVCDFFLFPLGKLISPI